MRSILLLAAGRMAKFTCHSCPSASLRKVANGPPGRCQGAGGGGSKVAPGGLKDFGTLNFDGCV